MREAVQALIDLPRVQPRNVVVRLRFAFLKRVRIPFKARGKSGDPLEHALVNLRPNHRFLLTHAITKPADRADAS
jgi:hypothetical protein